MQATHHPSANETAPPLSCQRLVIGYRNKKLLPAFDLTIAAKSFTLVVGRNGAGKSTWVKTLLGLIPPVSGAVRLAEPRPRLAYVPQSAALDAILPVRGRDVAAWGRLRGWGFLRPLATRDDYAATRDALVAAAADEFSGRAFRELSGGQKQRILFARMRASDADVVVLDEPTASMDLASEQKAYEELDALRRDRGKAVIVVTHAIAQGSPYADQVVFMDRADHGDHAADPVDPDGSRAETTPSPGRLEQFRDRGGIVVIGPPAQVYAHRQFRRHFGEVSSNGPA